VDAEFLRLVVTMAVSEQRNDKIFSVTI